LNFLVKNENADPQQLQQTEELVISGIQCPRLQDIRQMETHWTDSLVSESSPFDVGIATVKFRGYKWVRSLSNLEKLIQAHGDKLRSEILEPINYIWNEAAVDGVYYRTSSQQGP
jgi:hypothetical protein